MRIHFISIGGSVMHQLAIALKRKGYQISGSDDEIFEPAWSNLNQEGLLPAAMGWDPARLDGSLDAVILGMHAKEDNPELARARELQLPIYSFPEYIFQESRNKTRIVVGGSHGKTTTTAMIMHVLRQSGKDFDYLVGARLEGFDQSVNITDAPVIVCEGDEYPASTLEKRPKFHFLFPHIAIITGIAWDHINVFPTFENYLEQFSIFINKIEPGGSLIYNSTDKDLVTLVEKERQNPASRVHQLELVPYEVPQHTIENGVTRIRLDRAEGSLLVFGDHNLLNLHAAYEACRRLGVSTEEFLKAMTGFKGAAKRLELMARNETVTFFRDFAHAPSKVKATVEAVRQQFPGRKLIALLELHTYSSLNREFMSHYAGALDGADEAAVFYSQHALELKRMPPLEPELVKEGFGRADLTILNTGTQIQEWMNARQYLNAVVLLMSSGNYDGVDMNEFALRITEGAD